MAQPNMKNGRWNYAEALTANVVKHLAVANGASVEDVMYDRRHADTRAIAVWVLRCGAGLSRTAVQRAFGYAYGHSVNACVLKVNENSFFLEIAHSVASHLGVAYPAGDGVSKGAEARAAAREAVAAGRAQRREEVAKICEKIEDLRTTIADAKRAISKLERMRKDVRSRKFTTF